MAPPVPSDDHKKKHVLEMSYIVHGIDADESAVLEALECVYLERVCTYKIKVSFYNLVLHCSGCNL